jgi:hypothetical protein
MERGEKNIELRFMAMLSKIYQVNTNDLLTLWHKGQIYDLVKNEEVAISAI